MRRRVPALAIPGLVLLTFAGAWAASRFFRIPSFTWETAQIPLPERAESATLRVRGLKCRHASEPLEGLLFGRTDTNAVDGYLRVLVFPSPGVGEMLVTFDPQRTSREKIARAVKLDARGQETAYRVLLEIQADRTSPAALLGAIALSLEEQNEELFRACHERGALAGVDFEALVAAWGGLFLEGLRPAGEPDAENRIGLLGVTAGEAFPLGERTPGFSSMVLARDAGGWRVARAEWGRFREE